MTGKWDDPGVPHEGWTCVGIEDLGEPSAVCEMCESQEIRYVHSMQHPDYGDVLECGCICAGNMAQDLEGARDREDRFKSRAKRRLTWAGKRWRESWHGNSFLNTRGFNIVVFGSRKGWGIKVEQRFGARVQFGRKRYATRAEAQAAAFEALLWAEQSWAGNGRYDTPAADGGRR
jgi:hypothetical protein